MHPMIVNCRLLMTRLLLAMHPNEIFKQSYSFCNIIYFINIQYMINVINIVKFQHNKNITETLEILVLFYLLIIRYAIQALVGI